MPSLREIRDDIPLLAHHFLAECCRDSGKQLDLSAGVIRRMMQSEWPGNVRQLQNEIKRLVACARKRVITEDDLSEGVPQNRDIERRPAAPAGVSLKSAVEELESQMIAEMLLATGNNQQQAARFLGLSRQGLINKMKRYKLRIADGAGGDRSGERL